MRRRKPFEVGLLEDNPQSTLPAEYSLLQGATACRNRPSSATFLIRSLRTYLRGSLLMGHPIADVHPRQLPTVLFPERQVFADFRRTGCHRHSRQKVQARSAVPFAVELLPGLQVDGTWNVPTYYFVDGTWNVPTNLTFVGCVPLQLEFSLTSCIILGMPGLPPCVPPFASNSYSRRFRFYA